MSNLIPIKVGKYQFQFRKLTWCEEFNLPKSEAIDKDRRRLILAKTLASVSGLKIASFGEAVPIIQAISRPVLDKVWIMYQGAIPGNKVFSVGPLYKAPEVIIYSKQIEVEEEDQEAAIDRALYENSSEADREIMRNARNLPGLTKIGVR